MSAATVGLGSTVASDGRSLLRTDYVCKLPYHEAERAYHQDGVLWPFSKTRNCSIWVALDDVDEQNGCTEFFAGS